MGTHTALYTNAESMELVRSALTDFLREAYPSEEIVWAGSSPFPPIYGKLFRLVRVPTIFALGQGPAGWCTAHFNCFSELSELANTISSATSSQVVVLNTQTTSCCYFFSLHSGGKRERAFRYEDGEWSLDEGTPLAFEASVLEEDIRESNIERYCKELGLPLHSDDCFPEQWWVVQLKNQPGDESPDIVAPAEGRSWWKRLLGLT